MWEAAEATDYEKAAQLRDTLGEIEGPASGASSSSVAGEDVDVFGVCVSGGNAAVAVLVIARWPGARSPGLFWEGVERSPPGGSLEILPSSTTARPSSQGDPPTGRRSRGGGAARLAVEQKGEKV